MVEEIYYLVKHLFSPIRNMLPMKLNLQINMIGDIPDFIDTNQCPACMVSLLNRDSKQIMFLMIYLYTN